MNGPFCTDCKHKYRPAGLLSRLANSLWGADMCCRPHLRMNLVTGKRRPEDFCSSERSDSIHGCGPKGIFFEPLAPTATEQKE